MGLYGVLRTLNELKQKHVIGDYAIVGGYAVNYYIEPTFTYDVDILVLLKNEDEYHNLHAYLTGSGHKFKGLHILIDGTPVQFLPNYISPLYSEAIKKAKRISFRGLAAKVITVEYLIAFLLVSYRPKDKVRIIELAKVTDPASLDEVLGRYEDSRNPLRERLAKLLERD